jgi:hypothetical protein
MAVDANGVDWDVLRQLAAAGLTPEQIVALHDSMVNPALSPEDAAFFGAQQNHLDTTYKQGLATNQYQRGNADLDYQQQLAALQRRYDQARDRLPGSYIGRGLLDSGIYKQGLQDYANARLQDTTDLQQRYQRQQQGFDLQNSQLTDTYNQASTDLENQRKARRQAIASSLRAVQ